MGGATSSLPVLRFEGSAPTESGRWSIAVSRWSLVSGQMGGAASPLPACANYGQRGRCPSRVGRRDVSGGDSATPVEKSCWR